MPLRDASAKLGAPIATVSYRARRAAKIINEELAAEALLFDLFQIKHAQRPREVVEQLSLLYGCDPSQLWRVVGCVKRQLEDPPEPPPLAQTRACPWDDRDIYIAYLRESAPLGEQQIKAGEAREPNTPPW